MENSNYSTEIVGSLSTVLSSTSLILYNKNHFTGRISVYNLNSFYESLLSIGDYQEITRESSQEDFMYVSGKLVDGFNVIIFIDPSTGFPSGYCDFVNTQGKELNLRIHLAFEGEIKEDENIHVDIVNSVEIALESVVTSKSVVGESPYEYTGKSLVENKKKENLYTDNALRLKNDPASVVVFGCGVSYKNIFMPLNLQNNILITPYPEFYREIDSYTVTYYKNDIVAYGWSSQNDIYSIVSLSRVNRYGTPIYYTPNYNATSNPITLDNFNIKKLPYYEGESEVDIDYVAGKYIYTKTGHTYDVYLGKYVEDGGFTDPSDPDSKVWRLPTLKTKEEAILEFPDLAWTYLNLSEYFRSYRGVITRKIGSWIIFKRGDTGIYVASSPVMVIYMTAQDLEEALFVNDQTLLLPGIDKTYYTLYNTASRIYYTERARVIEEGGTLINYYDYWLNSSGQFEPLGYEDENYLGVCSSPDTQRNKEYDDYYQEEEIKVIRKDYELYLTPLEGYRHRPYSLKDDGVPDFCCSFGGLLFWASNYKINYL